MTRWITLIRDGVIPALLCCIKIAVSFIQSLPAPCSPWISGYHEWLLWLADSLGQNSRAIITWTLLSIKLYVWLRLLDGCNDLGTTASFSLAGMILLSLIPNRLAPCSLHRDLIWLLYPHLCHLLLLFSNHKASLCSIAACYQRRQGIWYLPQLTWGLVTNTIFAVSQSPWANSTNKAWLLCTH